MTGRSHRPPPDNPHLPPERLAHHGGEPPSPDAHAPHEAHAHRGAEPPSSDARSPHELFVRDEDQPPSPDDPPLPPGPLPGPQVDPGRPVSYPDVIFELRGDGDGRVARWLVEPIRAAIELYFKETGPDLVLSPTAQALAQSLPPLRGKSSTRFGVWDSDARVAADKSIGWRGLAGPSILTRDHSFGISISTRYLRTVLDRVWQKTPKWYAYDDLGENFRPDGQGSVQLKSYSVVLQPPNRTQVIIQATDDKPAPDADWVIAITEELRVEVPTPSQPGATPPPGEICSDIWSNVMIDESWLNVVTGFLGLLTGGVLGLLSLDNPRRLGGTPLVAWGVASIAAAFGKADFSVRGSLAGDDLTIESVFPNSMKASIPAPDGSPGGSEIEVELDYERVYVSRTAIAALGKTRTLIFGERGPVDE